ncbi:hypothetical protein L914_10333, partial [Phytophthora nicotianae]
LACQLRLPPLLALLPDQRIPGPSERSLEFAAFWLVAAEDLCELGDVPPADRAQLSSISYCRASTAPVRGVGYPDHLPVESRGEYAVDDWRDTETAAKSAMMPLHAAPASLHNRLRAECKDRRIAFLRQWVGAVVTLQRSTAGAHHERE